MHSARGSKDSQLKRAEEELKVYRVQQETLKNMREQERLKADLYEKSKMIFKPITEALSKLNKK